MVIIFLLLSTIFIFALVVAPLSAVVIPFVLWARRHETAEAVSPDVASAPTGGDFAI